MTGQVSGCVSYLLAFLKSGSRHAYQQAMDIARPELKLQKRRRQIVMFGIGAVVVVAVTIGVMRLKPAAPSVERGTVWTDVVKRGSMLRQVRGPRSICGPT